MSSLWSLNISHWNMPGLLEEKKRLIPDLWQKIYKMRWKPFVVSRIIKNYWSQVKGHRRVFISNNAKIACCRRSFLLWTTRIAEQNVWEKKNPFEDTEELPMQWGLEKPRCQREGRHRVVGLKLATTFPLKVFTYCKLWLRLRGRAGVP